MLRNIYHRSGISLRSFLYAAQNEKRNAQMAWRSRKTWSRHWSKPIALPAYVYLIRRNKTFSVEHVDVYMYPIWRLKSTAIRQFLYWFCQSCFSFVYFLLAPLYTTGARFNIYFFIWPIIYTAACKLKDVRAIEVFGHEPNDQNMANADYFGCLFCLLFVLLFLPPVFFVLFYFLSCCV